jgi:hypothetical protein
MSPSVSVIIPAYNAADTLSRAIACCLAQSHMPLEVIVINDGSQDETLAIASAFPEPVRSINQKNAGPAAARNAGVRIARGDWLAFLDADDWWMPNKLERQLALAAESDGDIVHTLTNNSRLGIPRSLGFADLWRHNEIANSSALIKRSLFQELGGFDEHPDMFVCEDFNLWIRAAAKGSRILLCDELLTYYSVAGGLSSDIGRFLKGTNRNIDQIAAASGISAADIEAKRTDNLIELGEMALFTRELPLARELLTQALVRKPRLGVALAAAAAYLPRDILDLPRRYFTTPQPLPHFKGDLTSLFAPPIAAPIQTPGNRPAIVVIIDAEDEFDWSVLPPSVVAAAATCHQPTAQRIFRKHGIVPTYAISHMVARDAEAIRPFRDMLADGACEIGSQLHTWANPPTDEEIRQNAYAGNLPAYLEFEKIATLTRAIENNLGVKPILYRGGRYGAGDYTARILKHFGYRVDCTMLPAAGSWRGDRGAISEPYWCDPEHELLEIPITVRMSDAASDTSERGASLAGNGALAALRRLRLSNKGRLTPEGMSLPALKKMATNLVRHHGHRTLVFTYHSPSLQPGNTRHVRSEAELDRFLHRIDEFLGFFFTELNGIAATPSLVHRWATTVA